MLDFIVKELAKREKKKKKKGEKKKEDRSRADTYVASIKCCRVSEK